jgi:hypothetical protein
MEKKFSEDIVAETKADFLKRQEERRPLELNWRLNMNFLLGNQYAEITGTGDIEDSGKQYFWQQREVFNHIAPMIETRLAKLSRVRAGVTVRPATNDEADIRAAKLSTAILDSIKAENRLDELMLEANMWSEATGTAFYKVVWDIKKGVKAADDGKGGLYLGDVSITVCPPFEIFPECLSVQAVSGQNSIIHAKAYTASEVKKLWGKEVKGGAVNVFSLDNTVALGGFGYNATTPKISGEMRENCVVVIEKYELPSAEYPDGRLIIVAGEELLYYGALPFINGADGVRGYPFVKQTAVETIGAFFGTSIIERTIPVQRSYNIVKNRKHEFLNRVSMGVLAVEDGSVDTDNLEEEGLSPGKVLIYRQGSTPPALLNPGSVPSDFTYEESRLLQEFVLISGVSEIMKSSEIPANISSGRAIALLIEQDDSKIALTAASIRNAIREVCWQVLRLYKQFSGVRRLKRISGENGGIELAAFTGSDLSMDDLVFDSENELAETSSARKNMVIELLQMGLLSDEEGKLSPRAKNKVMEILGFGNWESARDIDEIHINKALRENRAMLTGDAVPLSIDDHNLHIAEHIRFALSEENDGKPEIRRRVAEHIKKHRELGSVPDDLFKAMNS